MKKAEEIEKSGKYYKLMNVLYKEYENMITFVDIWILVTTAETLEDIDELDSLQDYSDLIERFHKTNIENFPEDAKTKSPPKFINYNDITHLLNGFSRTLWYTSKGRFKGNITPFKKDENKLFQMREGQIQQGWMNGFNR